MTRELTPRAKLFHMITGSWVTQSIYAAARLGLADLIGDTPKTAAELAREADAAADPVYRLLRALTGLGLFDQDEQGRFSLTEMGALLRSDRPDTAHAMILTSGEFFYQAWGNFLHSVKTGECAFDKTFGQDLFSYLSENPQHGGDFDQCMATVHGAESEGVVASYDFSPYKTVADVGGGKGSLLARVLLDNEHLQGMLVDIPPVIPRAEEYLGQTRIRDRVRLIEGNFFASVPEGADLYMLRHVIHDWDGEEANTILGHCRKAMHADARLLLIECVVPEGNDFNFGKLLDLNMLVVSGGKERTEREFADLLAENRMRLNRVIHTRVPRVSIIEAVPV